MSRIKSAISHAILSVTLKLVRKKHVHLIDTHDGRLNYLGEGRVLGGKVIRGPGGTPIGISLLWTSVGTETPDFRHIPIERLRRDKVLGFVFDLA